MEVSIKQNPNLNLVVTLIHSELCGGSGATSEIPDPSSLTRTLQRMEAQLPSALQSTKRLSQQAKACVLILGHSRSCIELCVSIGQSKLQ